MKKIILLIIAISTITYANSFFNTPLESGKNIKTICDLRYNVEYIVFSNRYKGAISVRLDQNGKPVKCSKESRKNGFSGVKNGY